MRHSLCCDYVIVIDNTSQWDLEFVVEFEYIDCYHLVGHKHEQSCLLLILRLLMRNN